MYMSGLRARVEKGRLVLDEPTTLPEGTVVDLVVDDEGDDLTEDERRALHEALSASWKSAEAGRLRPASAILDELRQRRWACRSEPLPKQTRRSVTSTTSGGGTVPRRRIYSLTSSPHPSTSSPMPLASAA